MAEQNPFEHKPTGPGRGSLKCGGLTCEEWEMLLTEALDGLLPASGREGFDTHGAECPVCAQLLKQAKQGQEWLEFLDTEPEVPTDLVERIVGKTSGSVAGGPLAVAGVGAIPVQVLPVRHVMWDNRMMMTVAMAFFSIALTLNLAGVRLTHLKLSDLTPASMEMNLTRQFYGAKSSLVRYYDNLRLVYEVESKMRDLRRAEEMQQQKPQQQPQQQEVPANPSGNGHKNGGKLQPAIPQEGVLWGRPEKASATGQKSEQDIRETEEEAGADIAILFESDQAERGLA